MPFFGPLPKGNGAARGWSEDQLRIWHRSQTMPVSQLTDGVLGIDLDLGGNDLLNATNLPQGVLGYAQATSNQGTFTSETDLTGLSVTVDVPAGRLLKITAKAHFSSSVDEDRVTLAIKESTTFFNTGNLSLQNSTQAESVVAVAYVASPSAGSHTYKLTGGRANGTGNITMIATASTPSIIIVEDIGPA